MPATPATLEHAGRRKPHYRQDPADVAKPHQTLPTWTWDGIASAATFTCPENIVVTAMPRIGITLTLTDDPLYPISIDQISYRSFRLLYPVPFLPPNFIEISDPEPNVRNYVGGNLMPGRHPL